MNSLLLFAPLAALIAAATLAFVLRAYVKAEPGRGRVGAALVAAGAAAVAAMALYLSAGRPGLPDQPIARRVAALEAQAKANPMALSPEEMLALLQNRAREAPNDPQPHFYSGQIYAAAGDQTRAARAFQAALIRDQTYAPALIELGRTYVRQEGRVTPQAVSAFKAASALKPDDPTPWLYQALAASEAGDWAAAGPLWVRLSQTLPPDDPRHAMAASMIEKARAAGGLAP